MKVAVRIPRPTRPKRGERGPGAASPPTQNSNESPNNLRARPADLPNQLPCPAAPLQTGENIFQFNSLLAQICFNQLVRYTEDQYGARNSAGHRPVQTGQGWRIFSRLFDSRNSLQSLRLLEHLLRFANDEPQALARAFFLAYAPLSFEHDAYGEYIGPGVWTPDAGSRTAAVRVRRTLKRWCEWLEALAHFRIHQSRLRSSDGSPVDKAVIFLWPLHMRYNWSHHELLQLLRDFLGCGSTYPCGSETQLVSYCRGVLGLCKVKAPLSGRNVLPAQAVAHRLLKFLPAIQ